jgi:PKD repeat protein
MWTYPNNTGYTHCDMHQLEYVGNTLYTGSDGGIFKSTNQGGDFTDISKGLGIRMYYKIAQAESNLTMVGGGAQDNGGNLYKNGKWIDWFSADGMNTVIDWSNPNIIYGMSQNGTLYKSTNGGTSTTSITQPGAGAWVNPLAQDTKVASTIYYGGTAGLYKSTNSGSSWTNIYSALGQLVEIEVSPADNNYVYISKGSTIHVSMNAGASFVNASTGLSGTVEQIAPSPLDAKKVYAATSSGVFMSVNAGANWTNITGSLPAGGAAAIAVDNTTDEGVYAAIGYTVYYKNKNLAWIPFSDNLPFVDIRQLEYHKLSKKVRVGTYGRGIWESGAYNPIESVPTVKFSESTKSGCGLVKVTFTDESTDNVTSRKWSFPGGNPSTSTASIVTVTYSTKGLYSVTLEATNSTGSSNLVKKDLISVDKVDAPVTKDIFFCPDSKPALLTATKTAGTINWYSEKDTLNKIASGDSYTAPISVTTKYFVNAINGSPQATVGPVDTKIGANSTHAGGQYLVFTAFKAFDLLSVKMIATGTKDRTITLKDAEGNLIDSKTVSVPDGESVVKLNWSIPAGIDMQLGVNAGADLVRNSVGGVYPYSVANLVSITGNSAGAGYEAYYYYFYDWKIQEKGVCASKMVPVTATLNCVTATDNNLVNVSDIIYPNPVHNELSFKMNGTIKLAFYSVDGKLVKETILLNSERMMDVSNLANGIYTLVVENEGKKIITKLAKK